MLANLQRHLDLDRGKEGGRLDGLVCFKLIVLAAQLLWQYIHPSEKPVLSYKNKQEIKSKEHL